MSKNNSNFDEKTGSDELSSTPGKAPSTRPMNSAEEAPKHKPSSAAAVLQKPAPRAKLEDLELSEVESDHSSSKTVFVAINKENPSKYHGCYLRNGTNYLVNSHGPTIGANFAKNNPKVESKMLVVAAAAAAAASTKNNIASVGTEIFMPDPEKVIMQTANPSTKRSKHPTPPEAVGCCSQTTSNQGTPSTIVNHGTSTSTNNKLATTKTAIPSQSAITVEPPPVPVVINQSSAVPKIPNGGPTVGKKTSNNNTTAPVKEVAIVAPVSESVDKNIDKKKRSREPSSSSKHHRTFRNDNTKVNPVVQTEPARPQSCEMESLPPQRSFVHHDYRGDLMFDSRYGGMDCYADDREALGDFERFFNNSTFSDVSLLVGDEVFYAHRLILIKASEVFERMLSQQWSGDRKGIMKNGVVGSSSIDSLNGVIEEIELVEDRVCIKVFPAFLRFLYCNHIVLHTDNTLPILILADKYNVATLRKVCIDYAVKNIIPSLSLKDIFHIWFQYGTKCFHQDLINVCIETLATCCHEMITNPDWEKDWLAMDRDQLNEFLKCSELHIRSEFDLWTSVAKWIQAPARPERRGAYAEKTLAHIVPLIRFPFMTPDELTQMESSPLVNQFPKIFQPHIMAAYKFQALPLASRVGCREFTGQQFLLRNYSGLRWDKRIIVPEVSSMLKYTEFTVKLVTRASAIPVQNWDWELKIYPKGFSSSQEDFRVILSSNVILDQTRSVEYLLSIVDDKKILRSIAGKKSFSKTSGFGDFRYSADLEMEKRVGIEEIMADNSPLLINDSLQLQLMLKPID